MGRALITLNFASDRQKAAHWIAKAPWGTRVEFKSAKRTLPQNDRMWAMLTEVSEQLAWHGQKLGTEDWKLVFLDSLRREKKAEVRFVPNVDGNGFVNLGTSSSDLSKDEMTDLIELIFAFGAKHGVAFKEAEASAA